jgi:hypothetical protein
LCSGERQLLHSSLSETLTRSQWPRAWHSGLMHCTVQPGKYCTFFPLLCSGGLQVEPAPDSGGLHASQKAFSARVEPAPVKTVGSFSIRPLSRKRIGNLRGFCGEEVVVSREKIQYLVGGLRTAQVQPEPDSKRLHGAFLLAVKVSLRSGLASFPSLGSGLPTVSPLTGFPGPR